MLEENLKLTSFPSNQQSYAKFLYLTCLYRQILACQPGQRSGSRRELGICTLQSSTCKISNCGQFFCPFVWSQYRQTVSWICMMRFRSRMQSYCALPTSGRAHNTENKLSEKIPAQFEKETYAMTLSSVEMSFALTFLKAIIAAREVVDRRLMISK